MRLRKTFVKVSGNNVKVVMKKASPGAAICGNCGSKLHGIPRMKIGKFKNLALSKKRPNRPYGGNLCSRCTRLEVIRRARS